MLLPLASPDCAFPSITDDTHKVGPPARMVEAFLHFVVPLALLGLRVQPSKCVAWSRSGLEAFIVLLEGVNHATDRIRLLGVPLGTKEYAGDLLSSALEEDRRGLDQLQHLGDPRVAIRMGCHLPLPQVFAQRPSYLHRSCPPTPAFLECLGDFDGVRWHTLLDLLGRISWGMCPSCPSRSFVNQRLKLAFRLLLGDRVCLVIRF